MSGSKRIALVYALVMLSQGCAGALAEHGAADSDHAELRSGENVLRASITVRSNTGTSLSGAVAEADTRADTSAASAASSDSDDGDDDDSDDDDE